VICEWLGKLRIESAGHFWEDMKRIILVITCFLLAACEPAMNALTSTAPTMVPIKTIPMETSFQASSTLESSEFPVSGVFTPVATNTPWILPSGLSIEEHPLAKRPEIDPLVIYPLDGLTQSEVMNKHGDEWRKTLPPNEYYDVGHADLWVMQGNDKLATFWGTTEEGKVNAQVTRNGIVFFSEPIKPPGTTSPFRVLTVYDDHWVLEIAQERPILPNSFLGGSSFTSDIFVDGQSLNAHQGYEESYGFQTMHGRPFYFYFRDGLTGISYDGQEIPLDYEGVNHYGCCSAGALNPHMAQNMIGFFSWQGENNFYTEIGVFGK
jgi:hypothetical protein